MTLTSLNAGEPGKEEVSDRNPRSLGGTQDALDVVNQLFVPVVDDVVRGHSYSFAVLDGDGDMILETVEDKLSKRTLISP